VKFGEENTLQVGFLNGLSPSSQEKFLSCAEILHFDRDELIFRQNDPSLYLCLVKTGAVAIEVYVPTRGLRRILTLGPGELFSWSALIEPRYETASARAMESSEVFGVKGGLLIDRCLADCAFGYEIYKALAGVISTRLKATQLQMLDVFAAD
jgi:CRP/FNR family transcriptional regulator, cyclic AMP receptor protein